MPTLSQGSRERCGSRFSALKDPEFVAEAEKTRMTLNPIPGTTLHNMIVEGLSMSAALKKKLKPILAPKG
jgi:hypothetical protein